MTELLSRAPFELAGGTLGALMRALDWSGSPLGPPEDWPASLKATVGLMLPAQAQIVLFWGPDYVALYNDAYAPTIGDKHPRALGRPAIESWTELWDDLEPLLRSVRETGQTVSARDRPFYIERHGFGEDVFFDISYSAVLGEDGGVGGVLCIVSETTERVLAQERLRESESRLRFMGQLDEALRLARDAPEAMAAATRLLAERLGATRCAYADVDDDNDRFCIRADHSAPGTASSVGDYSLDLFGPRAAEDMRAGRTLVVRDVPGELAPGEGREMFQSIGIDAIICCPLAKDGRLRAMMAVHNADARDWQPAEIALVETVVERCWSQIERVGAEARLRAINERFEQLAGAVDQVFHIADPVAGKLLYVSPAFERIWGRSAAPLLESWDHFIETLHPDDRPRVMAQRAESTEGAHAPVDYRIVRPDGAVRWIRDRIFSVQGLNGGAGNLVGLAEDITDRREAEARLRESEERYRTLFTSIESGFCVVDVDLEGPGGKVDYRVIEANPAFYQQTGFPETILGSWLRAAVPGLEEHWFETYGRIARTGAPERFEEGSAALGRWFDVYAFRVGGAEEKRVAILFNDISARRVIEERLRESEAKFHAIANSIDQMVWSTRPDGFHDYYNDRWYEFTGTPHGSTDGDGWNDMFHPEDQGRAWETWRRSLETGEPYHIEYRLRHRSGQYRWVIGRAQCARDESGQIVRWFGTCTDIQEIVEARDVVARSAEELESRVVERTAELEAAHEQLRQSQKMEAMGALTGGVAHDFNNLLTPIVGGLDLLQRKGLGGEREQRLIAGAAHSADRARILVQRLLAFARRQPLQTVPVDVAELVKGMAELVGSTTGPQIKVAVTADTGLPLAKADPNQLEMALLNLAVNARDAMPEGGTLRISAVAAQARPGEIPGLPAGDYVRLSVADTGTGMSEDTLARAIEPFFSTKGIGRGTGLGLSMVHGLASQLGGALNITSKLGLGTNIDLWLPQTEAAPVESPPAPTEGRSNAARGAVLLVDDEELVRLSTADMLEDLGYKVIEADSSEAALAIVERGEPFDLLVTDHLMPGITGSELARRVRSLRGDLPVLVVSGYAESEGLAPDLPRLTKPFRKDELAASLAGAVPPG